MMGSDEEERQQDDTNPRIPTGPSVEDIVTTIDGLSKEERTKLLKALRALYGNP